MDAETGRKPRTYSYREPSPVQEALQHHSVSAVLRAVIDSAKGEHITIREIVEAFGERAFGFMLILFSLPNCIPTPPGMSGIIGAPVLLFGLQMLLGHRRPWLPGFLLRRSIPVATFKRLIDVTEPRLKKLESYCKPRLTQLFSLFGDRMVGLFAILVSLSVLIPFPFTNVPPSIALVIVSIAVMEEDGYFLIAGYLLGLIGLTYTATVLGASYHLALAAFSSISGYFGF